MCDGSPSAAPEFYVEIVAYEGAAVIERRGPFTAWKADKVDDGLNSNLNHEAYFTRIVGATDA